MADGANAGVYWHAFAFSLPAATTTTTSWLTARSIAVFTELNTPAPPKLALTTAGRSPFSTIQSSASVHQENCPQPLSSRVLTPWIVTPLATPNLVPPTVPAQCVPCPCTSRAVRVAFALSDTFAEDLKGWNRTTAEVAVRGTDPGVRDVDMHALPSCRRGAVRVVQPSPGINPVQAPRVHAPGFQERRIHFVLVLLVLVILVLVLLVLVLLDFGNGMTRRVGLDRLNLVMVLGDQRFQLPPCAAQDGNAQCTLLTGALGGCLTDFVDGLPGRLALLHDHNPFHLLVVSCGETSHGISNQDGHTMDDSS